MQICAYLHLTSGTHTLSAKLTFRDSVEDTEMYGSPTGEPSIIQCKDEAGIRFSRNMMSNKVLIKDVTFVHCESKYQDEISNAKTTLYIEHTSCVILENVAVNDSAGYGLCTHDCKKHVIQNCLFYNNTGGHVYIIQNTNYCSLKFTIEIAMTNFSTGNSVSGEYSIVIVSKCVINNMAVQVEESIFTNNEKGCFHTFNAKQIDIKSCLMSSNNGNGIFTDMGDYYSGCVNISTSDTTLKSNTTLLITNTTIEKNNGTGIIVYKRSFSSIKNYFMKTGIYNTTIASNYKALDLELSFYSSVDKIQQETRISGCRVESQRILHYSIGEDNAIIAIKHTAGNYFGKKKSFRNIVIIEKSTFENNSGARLSCSTLYVKSLVDTMLLDNVNIKGNKCTAITLASSKLTVANSLNITSNVGYNGGGFSLENADAVPQLFLLDKSIVFIINNTAETYGGGILSQQNCANGISSECFFQLNASLPNSAVLVFSGNRARQGGDIVFGGCLSNCTLNDTINLNKNNKSNAFWKLVEVNDFLSQSTLVEQPMRVAFCKNSSSSVDKQKRAECNDALEVWAYPGCEFKVSMMVADDHCFPSVGVVQASEPRLVSLEQGGIITTKKYCHNFSFTLSGKIIDVVKINFSLTNTLHLPASLTVHLEECPLGYTLSGSKCGCMDILKSYKVECAPKKFLLKVPGKTWIGKIGSNDTTIAVSSECRYCRAKITNYNSSNQLCIANRTGILCGQCIEGYSLKLGEYECADCSKTGLFITVLLTAVFATVGVLLVFFLLVFNLTVSTGVINGFIFYSNMVYLMSDTLLPLDRDESSHLQNVIQLLLKIQAWTNLDFGISVCYYDGYDTYTSAWMQFVFPLYIWFLILIIVLVSRYSRRVSRLTASNTVPVLATLMLLSYVKLLQASISSFSYSDLQVLNANSSILRRWRSDANVLYLSNQHIGLFLMSVLVVMVYIIPFTLLVLLGPLLQAKSHHKALHWVNRIKPFLDAFYGPYSSWYRYWPGILLLARLVTLVVFSSFYDDGNLKLVMASVIVFVLLFISTILRKAHTYRKRLSLEFFYLLNLGIFMVVSVRTSVRTSVTPTSQQCLAVFMLGLAVVVFGITLGLHIFSVLYLRCKAVRWISGLVHRILAKRNQPHSHSQAASSGTTHSTVEVEQQHFLPSCELREPLLTNIKVPTYVSS